MSVIDSIKDAGTDLIEKASSPASRAGHTVERVGKMVEEGIDKDVIALQMTKNSRTGKTYNSTHVEFCADLYKESKAGAVLATAAQTRGLIADQREENQLTENSLPA